MSDEPIAPYVHEGADAGKELEQLGFEAARFFILHMQRIVAGKRNHKKDKAFFEYSGHEVYKAEHGTFFIIYVVEEEDDGSPMVTLICAGRMADFSGNPERTDSWDAKAAAAAKRHVTPRLEDYFDDPEK